MSINRSHAVFIICLMLSCVAYAWMASFGSFSLFKEESDCEFFDYQARSLLQGRLDVPEKAIGNEAFVFKGKNYGYFGLTPAVLRIPFQLAGVGVGRLSRSFQVANFALCLVAAYGILLLFYGRLSAPGERLPAWATVLFTFSAGLGSTLYFLSSRSYIYHESLLCSAAFALASAWCSLLALENPRALWWALAWVTGVLSINARPLAGLFALGLLIAAATWTWLRRRTRSAAIVAFLGIIGVGSFNLVSYLRFRNWGGCPLSYNVQYTPERLARVDGKMFHLSNIPHNFAAYATRANFRFSRSFPWFFMDRKNFRAEFPAARIDMDDLALAIPYAMPALTALALVGAACGLVRLRKLGVPVALLLLASLPTVVVMLAFFAVAHRYTADFCPSLICLGAVGMAAIAAFQRAWRKGVVVLLVVLVLSSILATGAITIEYQRAYVWGVPARETKAYLDFRARVDAWVFGPGEAGR